MDEWAIYLVIGFSINVALYGVLINQIALYFQSHPNDKLWMRIAVGFVFLTETAELIFVATMIYLRRHGLSSLEPMLTGNTVMTGVIGATVQLFLCRRVYRFSSHRLLCALISILSIVSLAIALAMAILQTPRLDVSTKRPQTRVIDEPPGAFALVISWLALSAATDVALTLSLCYFIFRRRMESSFPQTKSVLSQIIFLAIGTGIATCACALLNAISHAVGSPVNVLFVPDLILPRLYSNSFLVVLNARERFSDILTGNQSSQDIQLTQMN